MAEDHTYTNGASQIEVRYAITNVSGAADLDPRRRARRTSTSATTTAATASSAPTSPRFVGGRDDDSGLVYGLQEITPWAALQEGDFELVFANFAGDGLNGTVDSAAPDNGVGVTWQLDNLAPGETRHDRRPLAARRPGAARDDRARRRPTARASSPTPTA